MALSHGNPTRRGVLLGFAGASVAVLSFPLAANARSRAWAKPIAIDGVPNLHKVSHNFYRSAQPTAIGMRGLAKRLHIHTVINLRHWHSDDSLLRGTGMQAVDVPMNTWHIETGDVTLALKLIRTKQAQGPVLLHCQQGADRTGLISALYRIVYQGWSKDQALDELLHGGFGYHAIWVNIPDYIRDLDIAGLKRAVRQ